MSKNFGSFSSDGWEYRITSERTPRRWMNYFGGEKYGVYLANDGTGYSAANPPEGSRVTAQSAGRFVYLREEESQEIWSVAKEPTHVNFEQYECRHGVGYTEFCSKYKGIRSKMLVFVPLHQDFECWKITLRNESDRCRNIQLFPYVEWDLSAYLLPWDAAANYSHCYFREDDSAVHGVLNDPLYPWITHSGLLASSETLIGWECGKSAFLGSGGSMEKPRAVAEMRCTGLPASTEICAASMQFRAVLQPGEEKRFNFIVAYSRQDTGMKVCQKEFLISEHMDKAFEDVRKYWKAKFSAVQIETPDENLNRMTNIWLKHQIYQANVWCRGGGCRGYRDTMQDAAGVVSYDEEKSLQQIRRGLRHQYADGYAPRQFTEEHGPHDVRLYADSPVWIPLAVCSYLKQTGNDQFLNEQIPFLEDGLRSTALEHSMKQVSEFLDCDESNTADVLKHVNRALDYLWKNRGSHGLCLMLGGDWNDALNGVGRQGRGESVWLSMMFADAMGQVEELCRHIGQIQQAELCQARSVELKEMINRHAWDGEWYLRAFGDGGEKIGSASSRYGQIYILSQSWAVISGTADRDRAEKALQSVKKRLDTPFGFLTMAPAYPSYDPNVGRISILRPGTFENSAVYCHASAWQMLAELMTGHADAAYEIYRKMNPSNPRHPPEESFSEPYVFPNCYFGKEAGARFGQSVTGWLTATADWIYRIVIEWMLGVRPGYDGIVIDPRLPSSWKNASITRKIRGCTYQVNIHRAGGPEEKLGLWVDGKPLKNSLVPYFGDTAPHSIDVVIM